MKNAEEQENLLKELKVLMEGINDAEANREKLIKISESPDNDFVSCVKKTELEKDMTQVSSLISKANILETRWKNWAAQNQKEKALIILLNVFCWFLFVIS